MKKRYKSVLERNNTGQALSDNQIMRSPAICNPGSSTLCPFRYQIEIITKPVSGSSTHAVSRSQSGFTLIELLVVVLIIGILAAVALPQYQKAVEKSKTGQALSFLKTLVQAEESFYMANGYYTGSLGKLDIELPWSGTQGFATDWSSAISNGEWALQTNLNESNSTTVDMVGVLRLTGEYKGAGFAYIMDSNHTAGFTSGLYCAERIGEGITFEKKKGEYCKLFGGTYVKTVIGLNLFSI